MSDKPLIELKSIQVSQFASQETNCYTASLFVDGARWGTVGNEGRGGSDHFHGVDGRNYGHLDILNKRIAATLATFATEDDVSLAAALTAAGHS